MDRTARGWGRRHAVWRRIECADGANQYKGLASRTSSSAPERELHRKRRCTAGYTSHRR
ncbi:hypothetical protein HYPSUDRAFT_46802 [Hypholoma sublateritium FD-334 SS-4]|uniref:Uncharacterized protein n=1 Tax=Hypholoma sublateritium (strain FD-334 SS-4) TaxID=945553 RepID=A0A0D2KQU5_HYPSF|nr:hypothetical protein HYPSUDRAFT_46802 [Hypholoma sublateritium FD-334 SS-4]